MVFGADGIGVASALVFYSMLPYSITSFCRFNHLPGEEPPELLALVPNVASPA